PALTALLAVEAFILLVASPVAATGHWSGRIALELAVLALAVLAFVISHGLVPTAIAVLAIAFGPAGALCICGRLRRRGCCLVSLEVPCPAAPELPPRSCGCSPPVKSHGIVCWAPSHCILAWA